eukprot:6932829-Prymnesium_polylepis.2
MKTFVWAAAVESRGSRLLLPELNRTLRQRSSKFVTPRSLACDATLYCTLGDTRGRVKCDISSATA